MVDMPRQNLKVRYIELPWLQARQNFEIFYKHVYIVANICTNNRMQKLMILKKESTDI